MNIHKFSKPSSEITVQVVTRGMGVSCSWSWLPCFGKRSEEKNHHSFWLGGGGTKTKNDPPTNKPTNQASRQAGKQESKQASNQAPTNIPPTNHPQALVLGAPCPNLSHAPLETRQKLGRRHPKAAESTWGAVGYQTKTQKGDHPCARNTPRRRPSGFKGYPKETIIVGPAPKSQRRSTVDDCTG